MTNEELRRRLVELCDTNNGWVDEVPADKFVDYLIANGVTIRERGEWETRIYKYIDSDGNVIDTLEKDFCPICGEKRTCAININFCSNCGADMRGEVIPDEAVKLRKNIKFETGDNAKIVGNITEHRFEIGTIVRLEKYETDYKAFFGDEYWWVIDDDLEPIEDEDMRGGKDE